MGTPDAPRRPKAEEWRMAETRALRTSDLAELTDSGWDRAIASVRGRVNEVRSLAFGPLTRAQQRQPGTICARIVHAVAPRGCSPGSRARTLFGRPRAVDPLG